jgi:hypothetical protein
MALKVYTTFLHEWTYGEADPISVHLTESGAKRRLIDYISTTLWGMSDMTSYETIGPWLNNTLNKFDCAYDEGCRKVVNLSKTDIDELFSLLFDYNENWCDEKFGVYFSYQPMILEG